MLLLFVVEGEPDGQVPRKLSGGFIVKAYDKDLPSRGIHSEELLGEATTDGQGRYKIRYTAHQFPRAEKKRADLFVLALTADGKTVGKSAVIFNAGSSGVKAT